MVYDHIYIDMCNVSAILFYIYIYNIVRLYVVVRWKILAIIRNTIFFHLENVFFFLSFFLCREYIYIYILSTNKSIARTFFPFYVLHEPYTVL